MHSILKGWENILFELGIERVNVTASAQVMKTVVTSEDISFVFLFRSLQHVLASMGFATAVCWAVVTACGIPATWDIQAATAIHVRTLPVLREQWSRGIGISSFAVIPDCSDERCDCVG